MKDGGGDRMGVFVLFVGVAGGFGGDRNVAVSRSVGDKACGRDKTCLVSTIMIRLR